MAGLRDIWGIKLIDLDYELEIPTTVNNGIVS